MPAKKIKASAEPARPDRLELVCSEVVIQAAADAQGEQKLPRVAMVAYTGNAIRVSRWGNPVVVDLANLAIRDQRIPLRFNHESASGVGHTERIAIEDGKLVADGVISRDTPEAREVVASGKNGFPWQASIGASVEKSNFVTEGQTVEVNGKKFKGPIDVITRATLDEISFVDLGADRKTRATIAAQNHEEQDMPGKNTESQDVAADQKTDQGQEAKPKVQATADMEELDVLLAKAEAATKRKNLVLIKAKAVLEVQPDQGERVRAISRAAIEGEWSEIEINRAFRSVELSAPPMHVREQEAPTDEVIEAAICMAGFLPDVEKRFHERVLTAAHERFPGGISLGEVLLLGAERGGYKARSINKNNVKYVLRAALDTDHIAAAGTSSLSIPGVLSNTANKFLRVGFDYADQSWRQIAAVRSVQDFKQVSGYATMSSSLADEVAPGGELKHAKLAETSYTNQAKTYGKMFGLDRQTIINDDLGALTRLPQQIGTMHGRTLNVVFWTEFMDNASFFASGYSNYTSGSTTGLGIDSLTALVTLFRALKGPDGHLMGTRPSILLVPSALEILAKQLMASTEIRDTTASTKYPTNNPHAGQYRVVASPYLGDSAISGYSAKAHYLLADPNDLPTIEVAFLNGVQVPTVESAEADFNVLGIQMRGYFDFGVKKQEPRGGCKSKGEA